MFSSHSDKPTQTNSAYCSAENDRLHRDKRRIGKQWASAKVRDSTPWRTERCTGLGTKQVKPKSPNPNTSPKLKRDVWYFFSQNKVSTTLS